LRLSPLHRGPWPSRHGRAPRLVQPRAARRPQAASRHSTSEHRALCRSTMRCGSWPSRGAQSVAPGSAWNCPTGYSRIAPLHLGAPRLALQRRGPWPSRCVQSIAPGAAQSCPVAASRLALIHLGASRLAPLRRGSWSFRCVQNVAPGAAQSCLAATSRLAALHLGASCLVHLASRRGFGLAACRASHLVQLRSARRPTAALRHSTSERHALRCSPLCHGPWAPCCVQSVAPGAAQIYPAAHSCLASLHLGASRLAQLGAASPTLAAPCVHSAALDAAQSCLAAQSRLAPLHLEGSRLAPLAAGSRPLAVSLRVERHTWCSSELPSGPQPPRTTPPRSVAPRAARRCVVALGCLAACRAWHLVQLRAAQRPKDASRHSTSEHRALRSSPLSRGTQSVTYGAARSCLGRCVAALGRLPACRTSHFVQLRAARRPAAASRHSTSERRILRHCVAALDNFATCRASRLVQLRGARPTAASRHSTSEHRV